MKLHQDRVPGLHTITACGADFVAVDGERHARSLVVLPDRVLPDWEVGRIEDLSGRHLQALVDLQPQVVLLGTGRWQRFPAAMLQADLARAGIGLEVMDTRAACRTYNILMAEGRRVAAALIVEAATAP